MRRRFDVLIVGGGPAGLSTAISASKIGAEVAVFEEHTVIGVPCHCAGIVSSEKFKVSPINKVKGLILNEVKMLDVYLGLNKCFTIRSKIPQLILNRSALDFLLSMKASSLGVHLLLGNRIQRVKLSKNFVECSSSQGTWRGKTMVIAEGVSGRIAGKLGFPVSELRFLPTLQYVVKVSPRLDSSSIRVHLLPYITPPFFLWVIPFDSSTCKVGLAGRESSILKLMLEAFLRRSFKRYRVLRRVGWAISVGGPLSETVKDTVLLVGDAAGQAKPTTGGGIISAIICGRLAGRFAALASLKEEYRFMKGYDFSWRKILGFRFKAQKLARKLADKLSWVQVQRISESISRRYGGEIEIYDLDVQLNLFSKIGLSPYTWIAAIKALG